MDYTDAMLDTLRSEGDPLADAVIEDLVRSNRVAEVNQVLHEFRNNDQPIPENLPPIVREFLITTDNPPDWADPVRITRVHKFFLDDGMDVAAILSVGSMVGCYAVPHGAKLLTSTHRLNHPRRRLAETSQFCLHMMGPNAFGAGGSLVPTIQKVRLIHAAVRHHLSASGEWDEERHGVPICQEDMLGALLLFSVTVLNGMTKVGVSVTPEEAEDYYHTWRVTGAMLGIRPDIMPETLHEARDLHVLFAQRHLGPSPEGVELTRNLLELYENIVPGKMFDGVIPALVRYVVGDQVADWMQVPRSGWDKPIRLLPRIRRVFEKTKNCNAIARRVLNRAGQLVLSGQMRLLTGEHHTNFVIPSALREKWNIECGN